MATKNPRLNITFEPETVSTLTNISKKEHKCVSSLVKELIHEALEHREDSALSALAEKRDRPKEKTISHEDAWK